MRSDSLATRTEVASSFPGQLQRRTLSILGRKGKTLVVQQGAVTYQTAKGQSVVMKNWKSKKKQEKMFLIAGVVLGVALLGFALTLLTGGKKEEDA